MDDSLGGSGRPKRVRSSSLLLRTQPDADTRVFDRPTEVELVIARSTIERMMQADMSPEDPILSGKAHSADPRVVAFAIAVFGGEHFANEKVAKKELFGIGENTNTAVWKRRLERLAQYDRTRHRPPRRSLWNLLRCLCRSRRFLVRRRSRE